MGLHTPFELTIRPMDSTEHQNLRNHMPVDVGEAAVDPVMPERQSRVIDAEQV
jgi:hypothetical protein